MKSAIILLVLSAAATIPAALPAPYIVYETAVPVHLVEESPEFWEQELEPMQVRVRRDVTTGVDLPSSGGARVSAQGSRTIWQGHDSRVDANAHWARTFGGAGGPPTYGGGLSYQQPRGGAAVDVSRTPGFGTQVGAAGSANLWHSQNGRSSLDATARWSRNYGGPWGTSRPNYGGTIDFVHRF